MTHDDDSSVSLPVELRGLLQFGPVPGYGGGGPAESAQGASQASRFEQPLRAARQYLERIGATTAGQLSLRGEQLLRGLGEVKRSMLEVEAAIESDTHSLEDETSWMTAKILCVEEAERYLVRRAAGAEAQSRDLQNARAAVLDFRAAVEQAQRFLDGWRADLRRFRGDLQQLQRDVAREQERLARTRSCRGAAKRAKDYADTR